MKKPGSIDGSGRATDRRAILKHLAGVAALAGLSPRAPGPKMRRSTP